MKLLCYLLGHAWKETEVFERPTDVVGLRDWQCERCGHLKDDILSSAKSMPR